MRIHVLQHVPFEGLGSIDAWALQRNAKVTYTKFYASSDLPELTNIDLIIVLGGPMSVNDGSEFPWLQEERAFIAAAIASGKAILGICLGSQMIAQVLGASIYPNEEAEIGWFPISVAPIDSGTFAFPESLKVFHWHGETYDLPDGAIRLASSAACLNQAFQVGEKVIGLQFHLETTPESAESIIKNCADELIAGRYIQTASEMRAVQAHGYTAINKQMVNVLEYLTSDLIGTIKAT